MVATGVEAEKEEDEGGDERDGAEEVDASQWWLCGWVYGDVDQEPDEDGRDDNEGDLDEEGPAPAELVRAEAPEDTAESHAHAEDEVADALPDAAAAQGDEIRGYERSAMLAPGTIRVYLGRPT